jgi:hypothetical protein
MTLRPSQMRERYRNIAVTLDPPRMPVNVSVTRYACQVAGYGTGQQERVAYKNRLYRASRSDLLGMDPPDMVDVFTGKGTVESIQKCLRLAARHRIYFHEGPDAGPGEGLSDQDGIHRVVDQYIGLDCNGFVGNWAMAAGVRGATAQRAPLDWLSHGRVRRTLDEIRAGDVIVWHSGTHIAAVESTYAFTTGPTPRRDMYVVESSTGGVQAHAYVLTTVEHAATVERYGHTYTTNFTGSTGIHGSGFRVFVVGLTGLH